MARFPRTATTPRVAAIAAACVGALIVGLLAASAGGIVTTSSAVATSTQVSAPRPIALVYRGPVSCVGCSEAAAALVRSYNPRFVIRYIGPRERVKLTSAAFRGARLYVQPGGDVDVSAAPRLLGAAGVAAIKGFLARGGRYLGICQGAYLAGRPGLGLLTRGDSGQYIASRGAVTRSSRDTVVPINWNGVRRTMFFQDGPYLIPNGVPGEQVLARYTNGLAAALVTPYGKGRLGLVGPHPEADRTWYSARLRNLDPDGLDGALGRQLLRLTLR